MSWLAAKLQCLEPHIDVAAENLASLTGQPRDVILSEYSFVLFLTFSMILAAAIVCPALLCLNFTAAYGRYSDAAIVRWAIPSARISWLIQEVPSVILPLWTLLRITNYSAVHPFGYITVFMFVLHYSQRSFIYTYLMRSGKGNIPIHLNFLGFVFCLWNGYIQGTWHLLYATFENNSSICYYLRFLGLAIFFSGFVINVDSDRRLRNLRKSSNDGSYHIPYGGFFTYVSSPNYFGEIVEWCGYALFAQTYTALAFAVFTMANTAPRGLSHHHWYKKKFDNYPNDRRAVIPFIW